MPERTGDPAELLVGDPEGRHRLLFVPVEHAFERAGSRWAVDRPVLRRRNHRLHLEIPSSLVALLLGAHRRVDIEPRHGFIMQQLPREWLDHG